MIVGAALLVFFHFMTVFGKERGWVLWIHLKDMSKSGELLTDHENLLAFSCFVTLTISTIASPLLIGWMLFNSWIKWSLAVFSAIAAAAMWYFAAIHGEPFIIVLALTATFTLAGQLCIKSTPRQLSPTGPA